MDPNVQWEMDWEGIDVTLKYPNDDLRRQMKYLPHRLKFGNLCGLINGYVCLFGG